VPRPDNVPALPGQGEQNSAAVAWVTAAGHQPVSLKLRDQARDRRLLQLLRCGQIGQPQRSVPRQGVQHGQDREVEPPDRRQPDEDRVEVLDRGGQLVDIQSAIRVRRRCHPHIISIFDVIRAASCARRRGLRASATWHMTPYFTNYFTKPSSLFALMTYEFV